MIFTGSGKRVPIRKNKIEYKKPVKAPDNISEAV